MEKMKMNESEKDIAKLKTENDALKDRLAKLEEQVNPSPRQPSTYRPIDYTAGMSMDRSAMQAMIDGSKSFIADLRAVTDPSSLTATTKEQRIADSLKGTSSAAQPQPQRRGSGYRDEVPLGPPPGIPYCDQMMNAQDARDRTELAWKIAQARLAKGEG
jgi:hypothetical protein